MQAGILLQCGVSGRCWASWQGGPCFLGRSGPNILLVLVTASQSPPAARATKPPCGIGSGWVPLCAAGDDGQPAVAFWGHTEDQK